MPLWFGGAQNQTRVAYLYLLHHPGSKHRKWQENLISNGSYMYKCMSVQLFLEVVSLHDEQRYMYMLLICKGKLAYIHVCNIPQLAICYIVVCLLLLTIIIKKTMNSTKVLNPWHMPVYTERARMCKSLRAHVLLK